jgi:hypothetical protein
MLAASGRGADGAERPQQTQRTIIVDKPGEV